MAQSNSFFGLRKGSTKSLTFQVLNGKQITKDRVYNVKNPQSLAQMSQRALMATVVTAYSSLKEICDHSFEGVEVGSKTMGEFMKENLKKLGSWVPNISVTEYKSSVYANNNYIVSRGTITPFETGDFAAEAEDDFKGTAFSGIGDWKEGLTYQELAKKCGLGLDGMITFMLVSEGQIYWIRLKFTKNIWNSKKTIADKTNIVTDMQSIDGKAIEGNALVLVSEIQLRKDSRNKINLTLQHEDEEYAAAIKSQKSLGVWKRSTQSLHTSSDYNNYDTAFATYPINTTLLLNGGKMPSNVINK